jgi:Fe-S-cluster containining protein
VNFANSEADWSKELKALKERTRGATVGALKSFPTAVRNKGLQERLAKLADERLTQILGQLDKMPEEQPKASEPDCHAGCSHCCHQWVRVSISEVLAIAEYLYEEFSEEQLDAFRTSAREYRRAWDATPPGLLPTIACPLLVDNLCAVYPVRPLIARGIASVDVNKCIERNAHPEGNVKVPIIRPMRDLAFSMREGVQEGLSELGLPSYDVVLGLALLVVLENPDAPEAYLRGEDVFSSAKAPD